MEPYVWHKWSSLEGNCVEVAQTYAGVLVRNSEQPDGPVLRFTVDQWRSFLVGATLGRFDPL